MTLKEAVANIEREHGKGAIMRMDGASLTAVEVIPTGAIALDVALGGGIPRGRVTEIYGPESSGKTTVTLHAIAEAQKAGGVCAFIDAEHALDPIYARAIGVDINKLWIAQPDNGEQALEIMNELINSDEVALIVVDSVAALTPRAEIAGDMGDSHVGLQARLMSQALRKIVANLNRSQTALIFVNQLREKIGVMFGSPETTPGGKALKYYASVRMDIRRKDQIKDGVEVVGNKTVVKVVKNKLAPPFRVAEFDIMYGAGISKEGCAIDVAIQTGILVRSGAWVVDPSTGEKLGQGREKAKAFLSANPERTTELTDRIMEKIREH